MWDAALFILLGSLLSGAGQTDAPPPAFFVKASITTAGPYGESWYLTLSPDGEASLQVFYSTSPSGTLLARFSLSRERVNAALDVVKSEEFFALPEEIQPSEIQMHRPRLVVEAYDGDRHHRVSLYDPDQLMDRAETKRFLAVWRSIFESLPLKPAW